MEATDRIWQNESVRALWKQPAPGKQSAVAPAALWLATAHSNDLSQRLYWY